MDIRITNAKCYADLEYAIRTVHSERGFDFTEEEKEAIKKAGFDKFDVAKMCCEYAVMASVECFGRYVIVAWNSGPNEETVQKILDDRYFQWHDTDRYPETENYCCEEWMIDGLTGLGDFRFYVLYGEYDE